jgi:hypothetical protein
MKFIFIFLLTIFSFLSESYAQSIYIEKKPDGSTVYTDKPKNPDLAVQKQLPQIPRYEPSNIPIQKIESCSIHGGNDCLAGPDTDGSIICSDGYKESRARYNFLCKQAKLTVENFVVSDDGSKINFSIRNRGEVGAYNIVVYFKQNGLLKSTSQQIEKLDAFGAVEIEFNHLKLLDKSIPYLVDNISISCNNCG